MNIHEKALWDAGFARNPNNIEGLTASEWYARGPGVMTVKWPERILLNGTGSVEIITGYFSNMKVTCCFLCVADFLEWIKINGVKSEPGVPGNNIMNVWN